MLEAVMPALAGFDRGDQLMLMALPMLAGMLIDRVVTATDISTHQTRSKMDPGVAGSNTLLAYV